MARDTSMLRDILFDELESLRNGTSEPQRAQAVAKLSSQIISTAKVELDYHKLAMKAEEAGKHLVLGSMDLGSRAVPAVGHDKAPQSGQATEARDQSPSMGGSTSVTGVNSAPS